MGSAPRSGRTGNGGHFTEGLFRFLTELRANNDRVWFHANKNRYESEVKEPMLRFIADFGERLRAISRNFDADPRPVGGSMFPRFMMSDALQTAGLFTFNAWALDGYQKVFWYEARLWQLWPQVLVLAALAAVFLLGARLLARRWETV